MNDLNEKNAFSRVLEVSGCRTQVELADMLGIKQSSISDAKKRNAVPAEWLIKLLRLKGINPEWVLTGESPKYLGPLDGETRQYIRIIETRPPKGCSTQELVHELVRRAFINL